MAKNRKRSAGRSKPVRAKPVRAKKERQPRTEVEIVDEDEGPGWETGVAVLTGILILVSILIVDYGLGKNYDAGFLF